MEQRKQTAVEWFAERIQSDFIFNFENVLNQAKQIEKEQMEDAYEAGEENAMDCHSIPNFNDITAEEYYNETYGQST
jgi:hypothetical protein